MQLTDTHCHIHESDYPLPQADVEARALQAGVGRLVCVGTDAVTSRAAVEFAQTRQNVWAAIGLHPHDADSGREAFAVLEKLAADNSGKIVAIGECGLDYFYENSRKTDQKRMLHAQCRLAIRYDLPMIFHVREAFDDFWPVFDQYPGLRGVVHSFTDTRSNLDKLLARGLYVGVNGIATFTKVDAQKEMYRAIPLERLVLETDAPFLTPAPFRGTVNEPARVRTVAEFLAQQRAEPLERLAAATTRNAQTLFSF